MAPVPSKVKPYDFHQDFERLLVCALCCRPQLFARLGEELEPEAFKEKTSQLAVSAAKAIAKTTGNAPSSHAIVVQRLRAWIRDGSVINDDVLDVAEMFSSVDDLPTNEELVAEVMPLLTRRLHQRAAENAIVEIGKGGDIEKAVQPLFERARRLALGAPQTQTGRAVMSQAAADHIRMLGQVEKMPFGIMEIDDYLGGGASRGTLNVLLAGSGVGKTMTLVQCAASSGHRKFNVAIATLEVNSAEWTARLYANLLGRTIDAVKANPSSALGEIQGHLKGTRFGNVFVRDFAPRVTNAQDILAWVAEEEKALGEEIHVLIVDSGDHVGTKSKRNDANSYSDSRDVYEHFFGWAKDNRRWVFTVSHVRRKDGKKSGLIDLDDVADSMHKIRIADLIISINPDGDGQAEWFFAKNRFGESRGKVGPLPIDNACARVAPSSLVLGVPF